jgi:peptidoglycan/xylan/chitin deacetylase (PgdA/CDA1 family)
LNKTEDEVARKILYPESQKGITISHLITFIEYFLGMGYKFVSPEDILEGLKVDKNYAMLTFDDGYYNNIRLLPILKEYNVPATVFVSTDYVNEGKGFWWDVVYRERMKRGTESRKIRREIEFLQLLKPDEIEMHVVQQFGEVALKPSGDLDRPFSPRELAEFSKEKYIHLGNHTKSHGILSNYPISMVRFEIEEAQKSLYAMTGFRPLIIAYPNGRSSREVIGISRSAGLRLGVTVDHKKNKLPVDPENESAMGIGRYSLDGSKSIVEQCESARSDFGLLKLYRSVRKIKRARFY